MRNVILQDRRITAREIANDIGVSIGSVHSVLTDNIDIRKVSAKCALKMLTIEQKQSNLDIARDTLGNVNSDPNFLTTDITGEETWFYGYYAETKMQSSHRRKQRKHARFTDMLSVSFDFCGVVHYKYAQKSQTITKK